MGFSQEWEGCYADSTHLSIWPWSDIVSLVHRHCKVLVNRKGGKVMEFGCGAGANIPLFLHLGMEYSGIEGSPTIVSRLKEQYPKVASNIYVGDFCGEHPELWGGVRFDN